jgi:hypothetical protein
MRSTATRFFFTGALVLTPLAESGCVPSGAKFAPASGVLTVTGTQSADAYVVTANAQGAIVVNGGSVPIQGGTPTLANTTRIVLVGRGGDDQLVLDPHGGALPGARVVGGPGNDVIVGGAGGDEFAWVPGDGEDVIDGRGGADTLLYTTSDGVDTVHVVANAGHALVLETQSDVTVDLAGVENVAVFAKGGADAVVVGELTGSAVANVRIDLAGAAGAGDGASDTVTVLGTQGPDVATLESTGGAVEIAGLAAAVRIANGEAADDLVLNVLGGDDDVDATGTAAGGIALAVSGGLGVDSFLGGAGDDWFGGGDGDDVAAGGPGDDTFAWNPGDDDDTLEGEDDFDTLRFTGANAAEIIEITATGARARLTRNIASVVTDLAGVEAIHYRALGGADLLVVRDLSSTDVAEVSADLLGSLGTGDAQPDGVIVDGTAGHDAVQVAGDATGVVVVGLATLVSVTGAEDPGDALTIGTGAGDDTVDASALATPSLQLTADGGADHDVLIGGDGGDVLLGGDGDDVLLGGPGLDVLDGGAGDNVVIQ